jgi:hypothetical protein
VAACAAPQRVSADARDWHFKDHKAEVRAVPLKCDAPMVFTDCLREQERAG